MPAPLAHPLPPSVPPLSSIPLLPMPIPPILLPLCAPAPLCSSSQPCLLLLARDFLNTSGDARESVKDNKASVPTPSPNTVATTRAQSSGADAVVVNNKLDVPESQMKFLDTSSGGKSAQRLFMEENSVGHRVHISYCQS